jgi:limonene-1,2-epoxide hydrolase
MAVVGADVEFVDRLVSAMQAYDGEAVRALCAPGFRHWVSLSEQESGLDQLIATLQRERAVVAAATMVVRRQVATDAGVTLMLTVDGTTKNGAAFHIPVCLVITLEDGRMTRIDEYANVDRAKDLIAEMFA